LQTSMSVAAPSQACWWGPSAALGKSAKRCRADLAFAHPR